VNRLSFVNWLFEYSVCDWVAIGLYGYRLGQGLVSFVTSGSFRCISTEFSYSESIPVTYVIDLRIRFRSSIIFKTHTEFKSTKQISLKES